MSSHACKDCGTQMKVYDTSHGGKFTFRKLRCRCGSGFETTESITRRLPSLAISGQGPPLVDASPLPVSGGGVGGGLSSGSVLPPDSGPVSMLPDQTPARRKRRTTVEYDPVFDAEWNQTAKTGSKDLCQQEWIALGKPPFGESWKVWEQCAEWRQDWYHYPHVVKWLRDGRYKQFPDARVKTTVATPVLPFAKRAEDEAKARAIAARAKSAFGGG